MTAATEFKLPDVPWIRPIENCVRCNYLLRGLDETGRCPECGEPFDLDGFTFTVSSFKWLLVRQSIAVAVIAILCVMVATFFPPAKVVPAVTGALIGCLTMIAILLIRGSNNRFVVTRKNLFQCRRGKLIQAHDLDGLRMLTIASITGNVVIRYDDRATAFVAHKGEFVPRRRAKEFVRIANAWLMGSKWQLSAHF